MIVLFNPWSTPSPKKPLPMSLLAIGSMLDGEFEYRIVDGNIDVDPAGTILAIAEQHPLQAIAVTVMPGSQLRSAVNSCRQLKRLLPAVPIIWGGLGATFIIVLAALQSIPDDLLEAARLDGAGAWGQFTGVTLPLLAPTLLFLSTVGVIAGMLTFGEIDMMTNGGPGGRTDVVAYSLYTAAFRDLDQGRAAAIAVLLFLVIALLTGLQLALLRRRIHVAR